jgi:hypothetical protein
MHTARAPILVCLLVLLACESSPAPASGPDAPQPGPAEPRPQDTGHAQAEIQAAVAQAQAQVDAQAQAEREAQEQAAQTDACEAREPAAIEGPACVTGRIACGDTIQGTTAGGSRHFDGDRYLHSYCFPTTADSHQGTERVYAFEIATDQRATFTLDSPCADLDLAVLRWQPTDRCPAPTETISECEGTKRAGKSVKVWNNRPARYLVIVDGAPGEGANFDLSVTCEQGD